MRHLQSFKYIKAIVEAGSIRGAAESLTISPSALNRHIQTLEAELELKLFERLTRGVQLSFEGELFYTFALNQIASFERVQSQISSIKGLNVGQLRIGVSHDLHIHAFQRFASRFQRDNSKVDLVVEPLYQEQLYDALNQRRIDLALFINPVMRKGMQILHGIDIILSGFVPVGTSIARDETLNIYELSGIRLALPPRHSEVARRLGAAAEKSGIEIQHHYLGPDPLAYLERVYDPVVGIAAIVDPPDQETRLTGYRRVPLNHRYIGTCTMCLLSAENFGMSRAAHRFQEMFSEAFQ